MSSKFTERKNALIKRLEKAHAENGEMIVAASNLLLEIEAFKPAIMEDEGMPAAVNAMSFPGQNLNDRIEKATEFILDKWGRKQYDNPRFPAIDVGQPGHGKTSQVCLPGILVPPISGGHDIIRTLWAHPCIPIQFAPGWNSRLWAVGHSNNYDTDENWWINEEKGSPNSDGHCVPVAMPHTIDDGEGRLWTSYQCTIQGLNLKTRIEGPLPSSQVVFYGHHTNARLAAPHLTPDFHRSLCKGIKSIPSSFERLTPYGIMKTSPGSNGWMTSHLLDARLEKCFIEYCQKAVEVTGIGLIIEGASYYGQCGVHVYGISGFGDNVCRTDWTHNAHESPFGDADSQVAYVAPRPKGIAAIASQAEVWLTAETAPATKGGFVKGKRIW